MQGFFGGSQPPGFKTADYTSFKIKNPLKTVNERVWREILLGYFMRSIFLESVNFSVLIV